MKYLMLLPLLSMVVVPTTWAQDENDNSGLQNQPGFPGMGGGYNPGMGGGYNPGMGGGYNPGMGGGYNPGMGGGYNSGMGGGYNPGMGGGYNPGMGGGYNPGMGGGSFCRGQFQQCMPNQFPPCCYGMCMRGNYGFMCPRMQAGRGFGLDEPLAADQAMDQGVTTDQPEANVAEE
ncbi:hypothetical protein V1264_020266 [Littorina saxatilis]|uniref:Uncharacterized protein n=1 Tax=Littorina saxatilis TaxID=31220 RepID=A0AAN9BB78_9CAEN